MASNHLRKRFCELSLFSDKKIRNLEKLKLLDSENSWKQRNEILSSFLQTFFKKRIDPITILEAGCGKKWFLSLENICYQLTGVDLDKKALEIRKRNKGDLTRAIVGDLQTIQFRREEFDAIYCCNVLEHLSGAKKIIDKYFEWLKFGGLLVLIFPDRDTIFGFLTRITPHWFHVSVYKHIFGVSNAGKSGYGPYPTYYDKIVSRRGIREYCHRQNYKICLEYGRSSDLINRVKIGKKSIAFLYRIVGKLLQFLSLGRISADHGSLIYVIQKTN